MEKAREKLLPGSALSLNQHKKVGLGDPSRLIDQLAHTAIRCHKWRFPGIARLSGRSHGRPFTRFHDHLGQQFQFPGQGAEEAQQALFQGLRGMGIQINQGSIPIRQHQRV